MAQQTEVSLQDETLDAKQSELRFPEIDPALPAGNQIFDVLQAMILTMELPPGQAISESDIASKFGSSRTPVREALQKLRDAQLVTTKPSRGNFVTKLQRHKMLEARFMREALEVAAVDHLCKTGLPDAFTAILHDNLKRQKKAIKRRDNQEFRHLDDAFHLTLARATQYPRVADVLKREKILLDRLRVLALRSKSHQKSLLQDHQNLLTLILDRNKEPAIELTRRHMNTVLDTLSGLEQTHSHYFEPDSVIRTPS